MKGDSLIRLGAFLLLVSCLLMPLGAYAQEAAIVSDAVKSKCQRGGGELLAAPCLVSVVSPYGTPTVVLRAEPSNSYDAVAVLTVGQTITAVGMSDTFYFVLLADETTGWLAGNEVKITP